MQRVPPPAAQLGPDQLRAAIVDLGSHTFAVVRDRAHARQLYRSAEAERLGVRLPVRIAGGWRVDLS